MKKILCCLLAVISYRYAFSQDTVVRKAIPFYLQVIDSTSGRPIANAHVLVRNNAGKHVWSTRTDSLGLFQSSIYSQQKYLVNITAMGYTAEDFSVDLQTDNNIQGHVKLKPSPQSLQEVTVTSRKPVIQSDIDKLVYYAENDITSAAGDATDVLRKAPMVTVDPDGNVSLRGAPNPRILVNGKTSSLFLRNVADALKSIPASQISRIEVITNPSARYDGEGSAGIINIVTRKNFQEGMNGNFNTGISNLRNNASANLAFKQKNVLFYTNFNGNFSFKRRRPGINLRQDFVYQTTNRQELIEHDHRRGAGAQAGVEINWSTYHQLQALIGFNRGYDFQRGNMTGTISDVNLQVERFTRNIKAPGNGWGQDYYLDYTRRFKEEDKFLSLSVLVNRNKGHSRYRSDLEFLDPYRFYAEMANKQNRNNETTFQCDFSTGWWKGKLETGGKAILRDFVNDFQVFQYDDSSQELILNPGRTNLFQFRQQVFAGYLQYLTSLSKTITLRIGARAEWTRLATVSNQLQQTPSVNTGYLNLLPTIALAKSMGSGNQQVKLSYSKRLQRPGTIYMNPFISSMDSYNRTQGNPYLRPEIVHSPEIGYTLTHADNFYGVTVFYRITSQIIERYSTLSPDSANGNGQGTGGIVSTTSYDNIGRGNSLGMQASSSIRIRQNISLRGNLNLYFNETGTNASKYYYSKRSVNNTVLSGNINLTWRLKSRLSLEGFFTARTSQRNIQGEVNGFTLFNLAARKNILKDAASVSLIVTEPFRRGTRSIRENMNLQFYSSDEVLTPNRSVAVNFNLNFGKLKANQRSKRIQNDDMK